MREIKFRAWDKHNQMMVELSPVFIQKRSKYNVSAFVTGDAIDSMTHRKDYELMQFTGLKDKNDKEIYEGDILRWWVDSTHKFAEELLEVRWGTVGWILKSPLFKKFGISAERATCSEVNTFGYTRRSEVIGNVYENPELLVEKL